MHYVTLEDCIDNLFQIAIDFDSNQQTPPYELNVAGMRKLQGVLERVQSPYYTTIFERAAYLLVAINKGHYFHNGNKRLSLIVTLVFLYTNDFSKHRPITKKAYENWFSEEFPKYPVEQKHFHKVMSWAFYNLGKAVASDTSMNFDELKSAVEKFIRLSFKRR